MQAKVPLKHHLAFIAAFNEYVGGATRYYRGPQFVGTITVDLGSHKLGR
jgi:hypothetical protein